MQHDAHLQPSLKDRGTILVGFTAPFLIDTRKNLSTLSKHFIKSVRGTPNGIENGVFHQTRQSHLYSDLVRDDGVEVREVHSIPR